MQTLACISRRICSGLAIVAALLVVPAPTQAQESGPPISAILTIDQDALFKETLFGKAMIAAADKEAEALKVENRSIDTALEAEERGLTDRRQGMPLAEFRTLADAFDAKVRALRTAQDAKSEAFLAKREAAQQQFFQTVAPLIGDYMVERGASAIVSQAAIVVSLGAIDITDEVIARIDAKLGDGSVVPGSVPKEEGAPATP